VILVSLTLLDFMSVLLKYGPDPNFEIIFSKDTIEEQVAKSNFEKIEDEMDKAK